MATSTTIMEITDSKDADGGTALHCAVFSRKMKVINSLLQNRPNVEAANKHPQTPLHIAAYRGKTETMQRLLSSGVAVDSQDEDGQTALQYAASRGKIEAIDLLLQNGANVEAANKRQQTPLHMAACNGETEAVQRLFSSDAAVGARDEDSQTALHYAASRGNIKIIDLLWEDGANVRVANKHKQTPLHLAACSGETNARFQVTVASRWSKSTGSMARQVDYCSRKKTSSTIVPADITQSSCPILFKMVDTRSTINSALAAFPQCGLLGTFGEHDMYQLRWLVLMTLERLEQWVSIKILTAEQSQISAEVDGWQNRSSREVASLQRLKDCSHVVRLLDTFVHEGPNGSHQCIVLELLGPTINMIVDDSYQDDNGLCVGDILKMTQKLLAAVACLHDVGLAHGGKSHRIQISPALMKYRPQSP
ncbi:hypothetical protein MRB53_038480 [Persea americana]|nr:hypothetical protein MRB53_038480 [Persea americana]